MLIFILLFSMLRSLQGAPAAPSSSLASAGDTLSLISRGDPPTPDGDGQNLRTRFSIVQSCLLTIFACVWTAIHPNINGPRDSWWTCFKRKVTTTLVALIAPELILFWAMRQRFSAKEIADEYNAEFAKVEDPASSLLADLVALFKPLPKCITRRGIGQRWTVTHGFFVQMGGFLLYKNEFPIEVLDSARLSELIRNNLVNQPTVTERELQDRSKGDAIAKGVVVWQTMWFALQCCARLARHLPLSELEVVTLAFTVVNVAIYVAWWDKPQSVDTTIWLQLKESGDGNNSTEPVPTADEFDAENGSDAEPHSVQLAHLDSTDGLNPTDTQQLPMSDDVHHNIIDIRPLMAEDKPYEKESWFRRKLRKDRQNYSSPMFLLSRLQYRIMHAGYHYTLSKVGQPDGFDGKRLRVPMFYAADNSSRTADYSLAVIALIFGALHFIAWGSDFPSRLDQVLWRCAAIALVAFPSFWFLVGIIQEVQKRVESKVLEKILDVLQRLILWGLIFPSIILYLPARLVVIILALNAIHNPSGAILQDISWTSFIPHL